MRSLHRHAVPLFVCLVVFAALSGCNCQDRIRLVNTYGEEPELARGGEPYNALNADAGMGHCEDADGDGYGVGNGCLGPDCDDGDSKLGGDGRRLCYSGESGTQNVGACHAGLQSCQNGVLGACVGEVVPQDESCDSTDNDCDGQVDEQVTRSCYSGPQGSAGVGACAAGTQSCSNGVFGACTGEVEPSPELCDAVDNDCDGEIDDGVVRSCYVGPPGTEGVGLCQTGTQSCSAGAFGPCQNQVTPTPELCDNADNDCNGQVDEGVARICYSGPAGTSGIGACVTGLERCSAGGWGACSGERTPSAESCDNVDNDCDGLVDEEVTRQCYSAAGGTQNVGVCGMGVQTCTAGAFGSCAGETTPSAEVCDNLDNDCDGAVDEALTRSCYSGPAGTDGLGVCEGGTQTCTAGVFGSCVGETTPSTETCDDKDNDCDGAVDEALSRSCYAGPAGTDGVGACATGTQSCSAGSYGTCTGQTVPSTESCDGVDNDCDGAVDEEVTRSCYAGPAGTSGVGVCQSGTQTCTAGAFGGCVGETTPSAETCDALDNDCDGAVDEAITRSCYSGPSGTGGVGACAGGTQTCSAGAFGSCVGEATPSAESCDNVDNDCDGAVDEEVTRSCYSGPSTTRGVGVCLAGTQRCSAGAFGACLGEVTPNSESCDDLDNDCDGLVDDGVARSCYSGPEGTSGVGVCRAGTQSCASGVFGACVGEVTPSAETCDAQDDDCDGQVDEAVTRACYSGPSGTIGVGVCQAGSQSCVGGAFGACVGERTPSLESCDSADNDCDGAVDDAVTRACYSGPSSTQDVGVCKAGAQTCTGGVFGVCGGEQTPLAETCDGADNNCNGQLDENQTRIVVDGSSQTVNTSRRPVDVIFVIDNSERMNDDIIAVERNINNNFAAVLDGANVDYRVIMLSKHGSASNDDSICIEGPLSGTTTCSPPYAACPSNGARFFHYSAEIGLHDSLYKILETYRTPDDCGLAPSGWSSWLRERADKVFIEITKTGPLSGNTSDPNKQTADSFEQQLFALSSTMFGTAQQRNYKFHSIVGVDENVDRYAPWLPSEPLVTKTCVGTGNVTVTNGIEYQKLSIRSGGLRYPVCDHNIIASILRDIAEGIIVDSEMACDFQINPLPSEPNASIEFVPSNGGARLPMTRVANDTACAGDAFYISGTTVTLCPEACARWRQDQTAQLDVIFRCQ